MTGDVGCARGTLFSADVAEVGSDTEDDEPRGRSAVSQANANNAIAAAALSRHWRPRSDERRPAVARSSSLIASSGTGRRVIAGHGRNRHRALHSRAMSPSAPFHSLAEKRSWALHREVATRLLDDPAVAERARVRVEGWLRNPTDHPYAKDWQALLARSTAALAEALVDTSSRMCTLRQASPFAGALDNRTRWRILKDPELRES
jgi:hypothetical protein